MFLAKEYSMCKGVGISDKKLPSFDKALLKAGVGNYNLVRLSSILPAKCKFVNLSDIKTHIKEGSLLPIAYSTISSDTLGDKLISTIGVGIPEDEENVGVIMEYSTKNVSVKEALNTLEEMIEEAFEERGWKLKEKQIIYAEAIVSKNATYTTFAGIPEW